MRHRSTDRQRVGLKNRQHQRPCREARALVANAAELASAIVAIGILNARIGLRSCVRMGRMRLGHRRCHGFMAVMHLVRWRVMRRAECRHFKGMVRIALRHRHPGARPKPQRHQAKQETKEKSAHVQIISQGPACRPSARGKTLTEPGEATQHSKHPAPPCRPTEGAHGCLWPAPCPAPRPIGRSC